MADFERERSDPWFYHVQRALEQVQTLSELSLVRLFAVLFPLWEIETSGTRRQRREYELLERFLERGIEAGQMRTRDELASFFGLEPTMVERVLDFLITIRHVNSHNGILSLTDLGQLSVSEDKNVVEQQSRRKLYFDAFYSQPLTKPHYSIRILSEFEAADATSLYTYGIQFRRLLTKDQILSSHPSWQPEALSRLERDPQRHEYNLPDEVHGLTTKAVASAYLPMYIIETWTRTVPPRPYYVVYTRVRNLRDEHFERLLNNHPELTAVLYAEDELDPRELWINWLEKKEVPREYNVQPRKLASGSWRVSLPGKLFEGRDSKVPLSSLGTYLLERGYFLHIWSDDVNVRQKAVFERILRMIKKRKGSAGLEDIQELLQRFSEQLQTPGLTIVDMQRYLDKVGKSELLNLPAILDE